MLLLLRGITIAVNAPDKFGALLTVGFTVQVVMQAVLNMAVVTNTIPNTGISLPFFSSGGTSLVLLMAEMGVMIHIGRNGERAAQARRAEKMERLRRDTARPPIRLEELKGVGPRREAQWR